MCTTESLQWLALNLERDEIAHRRVIEVGSCDVNGTVRPIVQLLKPAEYIGVDITWGPGVDQVCYADELVERFGETSFDVVVSACALEHIRDWRSAVSNMKRVCRPDGLMLIMVPHEWPYHEHPYDFWRYGREDVSRIFADCEILRLDEDALAPSLVYAKIRRPAGLREIDLHGIELYSILVGRRVTEIRDEFLTDRFAKRMMLRNRIQQWSERIAWSIMKRI